MPRASRAVGEPAVEDDGVGARVGAHRPHRRTAPRPRGSDVGRVGSCSPPTPCRSRPPTRSRVSRWGSGPTRRPRTAGSSSTSWPARSTTTTSGRCGVWGCPPTGCRWCWGATVRAATPDGNEVIVHAVIPSDGWRGDETLDPRRTPAVRAARRHARDQGGGAPHQPRAQAGVPELGAGGVPADRLAHGIPDALHQRGGATRRHGPRPGSGRRGRDGARAAGLGRRPAGLGDEPRRGQGGAGGPRSVRTGRSRRGSGCPSGSTPCSRRSGRRRGRTRSTRCGPAGTIVISGATSGDAPAKAELTKIFFKQLRVVGSTMGTADELQRLASFVVRHAGSSRSSTPSCRWRTPVTGSRGWWTVRWPARSSSRPERGGRAQIRSHSFQPLCSTSQAMRP